MSRIMDEIYKTAKGLHRCGVIDKRRMLKYEALYRANSIKCIRYLVKNDCDQVKQGERNLTGRSHDEAMIEMLQRPGVAAELFKIAIKEDTTEELKSIMRLISAAGYDMSVTVKPKPKPRKRAKAVAEKATRHPTSRGRTRRSAAVIV